MNASELRDLLTARLDPVDAAAAAGAPARSDFDLNEDEAPKRRLKPAAVLAGLVEREGEWRVIFIERAAHLSLHAGQISFPGGRMDPEDADLAEAALREAHEEIGLARDQVELIGAFDRYETVTGYDVTPFVGFVAPDFTPVPDHGEVADTFEAPFAFLMNPANHQRQWRMWNGARRYFYAMPYGDKYIWGATAGMLKALHDRLYG